jgi:cellulose biosynthesis protein BcsE
MNESLAAPIPLGEASGTLTPAAARPGAAHFTLGVRPFERALELLGLDPGRARRIPGLPGLLADSPARNPAIVLAGDSRAKTMLLASIARDCGEHRRVAWVGRPGGSAHRLLPPAPEAARLLPFTWTVDAAAEARRLGPARVIRELRRCGMRDGDVLVVDALEPWVGQDCEPRSLEAALEAARSALLAWSRMHGGPVLALCRARVAGRSLAPLLRDAGFTRVASAQSVTAGLRICARPWGEPLGALRAWSRGREGGSAWCEVAVPPGTGDDCSVAGADPLAVHALAGAIEDADSMPAHWVAYDSLDDLVAECEHHGQGAAVLSHAGAGEYPALARAVHRLRLANPQDLPIVVREGATRLRAAERRILRQLGADALCSRDEGFGRMLDLLAVGRDRGRARIADEAAREQLLRAIAPAGERGYVPVPRFCVLAAGAIDAAGGTPVGHVIARLPLLAHVTHLVALLACFVRRSGDFVTTDGEGLLLFLHGCDQRDAAPTLEQLFELPVSELFGMARLHCDEHSQRRELERLTLAWSDAPADFTTALQVLQMRSAASADGAAAAAPGALPPGAAPAAATRQYPGVPARALQARALRLRAPAPGSASPVPPAP